MKTRRPAALLFTLLLAGASSVAAFVAPVRYNVPTLRSGSSPTPGVNPMIPGFQSFAGPSAFHLSAPQFKGSLLPPRAVIPSIQEAPLASVAPLSFGLSAESNVSAARGLNLLSQGGIEVSGWVFDRSGRRLDAGEPVSGAEQPAGPKLPPGVKKVTVDEVRTAADVDRLIDAGKNSDKFKAILKKSIHETAPFYLYTYHDSKGGKMVAVDLSSKPGMLKFIPELQPHEVNLIRKIQVWNRDLQVLVREDGKTPDLIVGGLVTEIKSKIGDYGLSSLINKANEQVLEHGQRHGLGHGAAAVDMVGEDKVQAEEIQKKLSDWGRRTKDVVLDKIFVFWEDELRVFLRKPDGSYGLGRPGMPLTRDSNPFKPDSQGPSGFFLGDPSLYGPLGGSRRTDLDRFDGQRDAERIERRIKKLAGQGRKKQAKAAWLKFAAKHAGPIVPLTLIKVAPFLPGLR